MWGKLISPEFSPNFPRISPEFLLNSPDFPIIPTDSPWFPSFLCSFQYNFTSVLCLLAFNFWPNLCILHVSLKMRIPHYAGQRIINLGNFGEIQGILGKSDEKILIFFTRFPRWNTFPSWGNLIPWFLQWLPWKLLWKKVKGNSPWNVNSLLLHFPFLPDQFQLHSAVNGPRWPTIYTKAPWLFFWAIQKKYTLLVFSVDNIGENVTTLYNMCNGPISELSYMCRHDQIIKWLELFCISPPLGWRVQSTIHLSGG